MKIKETGYALSSIPIFGPIFGWTYRIISIQDNCDEKVNFIKNDGLGGYECHPEYKSSLFVNTNEPEKENIFAVLDYEVFAHE